MADEKKELCRHCGHTREAHKMTAKNRSNVKLSRKSGTDVKDKYAHSFRNCPGFSSDGRS